MSCRSTPGNSAITSYAQATTGLGGVEIQRTFHDLKREGGRLGVADPTAEEVTEFLERTHFQVRYDEKLTPSRARSILNRINAAFEQVKEKILPDGATFHAWKNVVSEAWTRARRKVAATMLITALVGGCGGAATDHSANIPAHSTPVATAPANPAPQRDASPTEEQFATQGRFTGPAADQFGSDNVMAAYRSTVNYTLKNSYNENLATKKVNELTPEDLAFVRDQMTPTARASFDRDLANAGNSIDSAANVQSLVFYDLQASDTRLRTDGPGVFVDKNFTPAEVGVDTSTGSPRLSMTYTVTANARYTDVATGQNMKAPLGKTITYWLTPNTDAATAQEKPFLIDGWRSTFRSSEGIADTA